MKLIAIIIGLSFCQIIAYSQAKKSVYGYVRDKTSNDPIDGVIVQVKDAKGKTLQYHITDESGKFCIDYDSTLHGLTLQFQCMGYSNFSIPINNLSFPLLITLNSQPIKLKEVTVKAPDIMQRSDTLIYSVSKYATSQDRNIADVLKRLPGIAIEDNGEIKYNGEAINKFYIDGADFMDGRYNIATENIRPDDVESVEVLENHQPIRVLKGIEFSQQAGLNIKLREDARQRWIAILDGSIGATPFLYDASAFAMRIAGKWQSMETVKIDNTGWNPETQSIRHTDEQIFTSDYVDNLWDNYISLSRNTTSIDEQRTRDNFSTLVNTSNSWRLGEGKDMKFNLTYKSDRLDYQTGCETNYLDTNIPSYVERNVMRTQEHELNVQGGILSNLANSYLKENLYIDLDWNNANSTISGTNSLWQSAKTPSFNATNDLQLVKRLDDHLLMISSRNKYIYKPHSLTVAANSTVSQEITTGEFRSVTEMRYGWFKNKWSAYVRGGIDLDYYSIESALQGLEYNYPLACDKNFFLMKLHIAPEASYQSHKWLITLSAPVSYHLHSVMDKPKEEAKSKQYASFSPSIYFRRQISAKMDMVGQLKYTLTPPEVATNIETLFMTDYRNLYLSQANTRYENTFSATANLRYRNPINSTFFNLGGIYIWNKHPFMLRQIFIDDYLLTATALNSYIGQRFSTNGTFSKGLFSGKMKIGFDVAYAGLWATALRQNTEMPYVLRTVSAGINIRGYLTNTLSLDYQLPYTYNRLVMATEQSSYDVLKQYLTLTWIPTKDWQFSIGGEHYYTHFNTGSTANLIMLDASIRWTVSKNIDLALISSNLMNHREYQYANFGILSQTTNTYQLRGRNIIANIQVRI